VPFIRGSKVCEKFCSALFAARASGVSCGTKCDVLLRARSDIGLRRFSLVFPDFCCAGSKFDTGFAAVGGGVGSLAPVGLLPVCIPFSCISAAVTKLCGGSGDFWLDVYSWFIPFDGFPYCELV
jgi:hypothetical protein